MSYMRTDDAQANQYRKTIEELRRKNLDDPRLRPQVAEEEYFRRVFRWMSFT